MTATPSPTPGPDLLKPGDAARALRVHPRTLRVWRLSGQVPANAYVTTPAGHHRYHGWWVRERATARREGGAR